MLHSLSGSAAGARRGSVLALAAAQLGLGSFLLVLVGSFLVGLLLILVGSSFLRCQCWRNLQKESTSVSFSGLPGALKAAARRSNKSQRGVPCLSRLLGCLGFDGDGCLCVRIGLSYKSE